MCRLQKDKKSETSTSPIHSSIHEPCSFCLSRPISFADSFTRDQTENFATGVYKIRSLRGEIGQERKDRKSDERSIVLIPLLGGHLVNREILFVILLFSSLRLTSAWCQILHLSNGFLICLGFHLADIVRAPTPNLSFLLHSPPSFLSPLLAVLIGRPATI